MKKALAALAVAGALVLAPLGGQGAEPPVEFKGLLQSGTLVFATPTCEYHFSSCVLFAGTSGNVHPLNDPCFNNNAGLPRQNVDLRKEIFGADPQGDPAEESWGSKYSQLNVKDISKYTSKGARQVKFTLDSSAGYSDSGQHDLYAVLFNTNCDYLTNFSLLLVVGEARTVTIPKGAKWFLLYAVNSFSFSTRIHHDEKWHMTFQ